MNIKQIAKAAGVSVATVSRVLNHPENVSPKTRAKVENVMKAADYEPNWFAQGLNSNKTKTIGIIIPKVLSPVQMQIAEGAEEVAHQRGYMTFMCDGENDADLEREYINQLITRRVDGIILLYPAVGKGVIKKIEDEGTPVVLVESHTTINKFNTVQIDSRAGAVEMVAHLVKAGHKSIGILCRNSYQDGGAMLKGYINVLKASGIDIDKELISYVENSIEGGYMGTKRILNRCKPDAIFATSDDLAYGAMDAIKDLGYSIPDDIAVAGFGNDRMSGIIEPKLTTVDLPYRMMGIYSARILLDRIENENDDRNNPTQIVLQTKLKVRKSSGENDRIGEMF